MYDKISGTFGAKLVERLLASAPAPVDKDDDPNSPTYAVYVILKHLFDRANSAVTTDEKCMGGCIGGVLYSSL